jgi:DNA-binding CsgD family transcriptional regulator
MVTLHRLWPSLGSSSGSIAVFVRDPESDHLSAANVARTFGLTEAEARAAVAVSRSQGIADAASALDLSPNTVKTTLQRVFAKTGTHSQAELVRLLFSSIGNSRNGAS